MGPVELPQQSWPHSSQTANSPSVSSLDLDSPFIQSCSSSSLIPDTSLESLKCNEAGSFSFKSQTVVPTPLLHLPIQLYTQDVMISTLALIDPGATNNFISQKLVSDYNLNSIRLSDPTPIKLADGSFSPNPISSFVPELILTSHGHSESLSLLIADIRHSVVLGLPWLATHNPLIDWTARQLRFASCPDSCKPSHVRPIQLITDSDSHCESPSEKEPTSFAIELTSQSSHVPPTLPAEYSDYADVFSEAGADILPPLRTYDLEINLCDESKPPPFKPIYNLSPKESLSLKEWIGEQLRKGFIRPSKSPAAAPVFFVSKKDGGLRPCVDYRELNALTIKDRYPLPLISQILDRLAGAQWFTTLDLRGAYNLIRVKPGHEWKAAFRTPFGHFEPLVIPFGLSNAPAVFQRFINDVLKDLIDISVIVYLDDILVFSKTMTDHIYHVREVLKRLQQASLFAKLDKCSFHRDSASFLGYVVGRGGIRMCPSKTASIADWPRPRSVKATQSFLGFVNFYRRFVPRYSGIARPLTELTKKDVPFIWNEKCEQAFADLKGAIMKDVLLVHADPSKAFTLETDASDIALGAVLSQLDEAGHSRPVAFFSRKLLPAEQNYSVHDKELLAIVAAFKHWRHYLHGSPHSIAVLTDHNNLRYFRTAQHLKPRHARWAEFLSEFDFVLQYRPGAANAAADALSRREDSPLKKGDGSTKNILTLLPDRCWTIEANSNESTSQQVQNGSWPEKVAYFLEHDTWPNGTENTAWLRRQTKDFSLRNGRLFRTTKFGQVLYIPVEQRKEFMRRFHVGLGHLAFQSVKDLLQRRGWWPDWMKDTKQFISECPECQMNRPETQANSQHRALPLQPIPPVALPFERWGMDFISNLPETKAGNKHILTAIDYATRWVIAKAVPDMRTSTVVQFLYKDILMNFGTPYEIITDRGLTFIADAMKEFEETQKIKHLASSAYHPQTNGMVERMHSMLGHAITTLTRSHPQRWDEFLDQAVFALRVRTHAVTKHAPFYLLYGVHPRLPGDTAPPREAMVPFDQQEIRDETLGFMARELRELGQDRAASYFRSVRQAERMAAAGGEEAPEARHFFDVGDMVKLKHHAANKFEFKWKGPYHIVRLGTPGVYYLMEPTGRQLDTPVNQKDLAPWRARTVDNEEFFYDGRMRGEDPSAAGANVQAIVPNQISNGQQGTSQPVVQGMRHGTNNAPQQR